MDIMSWIWIVAIIIFLLIELATVGLASIWFMVGAVAALVFSLLGLALWLQFLIFAVVSAVMLIFTRRILVDKLKIGKIKTNVESLIGEEGIVTEPIEKFSTGLVKTHGQIWTALSATGEAIPEGTDVIIDKIEGVKLIVTVKE